MKRKGPSSEKRVDSPGGSASPPDAPRPAEGAVFSPRAQRLGVAWMVVALVLTALVAAGVDTPVGYLVALPVTSAFFTIPSIAVAAMAVRRVSEPFKPFWRWFLAGNVALYVVGTAVVGHAVHPRGVYEVTVAAALAVLVVCDALAVDEVLRTRSGARSRSVDLVESGLAIVLVAAPVVVLYGHELRTSPYAWFAVISLVCLVLFTSALWCTVVLFVRSPRGRRRGEGVGVALWAAAVLDAIVQLEHVVSGLTLAAVPVLVLNGLCMSLLLVMPLHTSYRLAPRRENRPPQTQLRSGKVIAGVTLAALPILGAAVVAAGRTSTAIYAAGLALAALVALSAVRQLLTYSETRRLYAEVERSAEDRRALLAAVLESMNADRRRVAMQLHQQASTSYAALASLVPRAEPGAPVTGPGVRGVSDPSHHEAWAAHLRPLPAVPVSHLLTERMAAQAESLRELIGAIRPQASSERAGVAPILQAYVDSLDVTPPAVTRVSVAEELALDWITETVALRVVQEAVRNTCLHAEATELHIELAAEDAVAVVRIADDGRGFDVSGLVVESGIATMRRFVDFCGGQLRIRSAPGAGTTVEARLGGPVPEPARQPRLRPVP